MKSGFLPIVLLSLAPLVHASTFTVTDPYPGTVFTCSTGTCPPTNFTGFDVLGSNKYDASSVVITTSTAGGVTNVTITLRFNYNNQDTSFSPFAGQGGNTTLTVGDLLFRSGGVGGSVAYGIPLASHGFNGTTTVNGSALNGNAALRNDPLVNAGTLYSATGATATSAQVLNGTIVPGTNDGFGQPIARVGDDYFRGSQTVFLRGGTQIAVGSINTTALGTANGPLLQAVISLSLASNSAFIQALESGNLFLDFSSATCANDVVQGQLTGVPEPVTFTMMGGGLLALAAIGRRRKAKV